MEMAIAMIQDRCRTLGERFEMEKIKKFVSIDNGMSWTPVDRFDFEIGQMRLF